jgi:hypothetical protein
MVCIGRKSQGDDELDAPQKDDRKRDAQDIQCVCVCSSSSISMQRAAEIQQQNMQQRHRSREMRRKLVSGRHCRNKFVLSPEPK